MNLIMTSRRDVPRMMTTQGKHLRMASNGFISAIYRLVKYYNPARNTGLTSKSMNII